MGKIKSRHDGIIGNFACQPGHFMHVCDKALYELTDFLVVYLGQRNYKKSSHIIRLLLRHQLSRPLYRG